MTKSQDNSVSAAPIFTILFLNSAVQYYIAGVPLKYSHENENGERKFDFKNKKPKPKTKDQK